MSLKILALSLFLLMGSFAVQAETVPLNGAPVVVPPDDGYTYVHVWVDGVEWIYVYAPDGSMVNCYPVE
jgi:hypothetical protein